MDNSRIILTGLGQHMQGLQWESDNRLRIGRQDNQDIISTDPSVERQHAEVVRQNQCWMVRDLAHSDRHPTMVNGQQVGSEGMQLQPNDVLRCGNQCWKVTVREVRKLEEAAQPEGQVLDRALAEMPRPLQAGDLVRTTRRFLRVQAATTHSWDQALVKVAFESDKLPRQGQNLLTLLRTGHHLRHIANLDELLNSVLADIVSALNAQRGSIVLADRLSGALQLRAHLARPVLRNAASLFSQTLTQRCFHQGESVLCRDVNADATLAEAQSVRLGTMSSIICTLLRSPRQRLGVMQLDRGPLEAPFTEDDLYLADAIAASVAVAIESSQLLEEQRANFLQTVTCLARAVEMRDQYTGDHTKRVTDYSLILAEELKVPSFFRYQLQVGTPLHDIGKIGIDDAVLRKPGKLTSLEFETMKSHTVKGADMLHMMANLVPLIPIVRSHHEKWDGSGYPRGLKGDEIPLVARIFAVADVWDALSCDRPYRKGWEKDKVVQYLRSESGRHFDPKIVSVFFELLDRGEI